MSIVSPMRDTGELSDRLTVDRGWVYMTGMQALVRLPIQQRIRDEAQGWHTGGYISGYRGSPIGRYDMELWQAQSLLEEKNIVFQPGLNEDLAITAAWGSQYVQNQEQRTVDGVFAIWYGKGPGVDRSMDPLRHVALAGTSSRGGILCLAGDDHAAKSSTVPNYSDFDFVSVGIPLLYPGNTQEVLDYGLHGIAMSRYSGCVVAMKLVTDVVEGGRSVFVAPDSPLIKFPEEPSVNIIEQFAPVLQEETLYNTRLPAAIRYARENQINEIIGQNINTRIGIVSAGKSYQDVQQALVLLNEMLGPSFGFSAKQLKLGLIWPMDHELIISFAQGLDVLIVVEEKRALIEDQVRSALYGKALAPDIIGKKYRDGRVAFPNFGELNPSGIVKVLREIAEDVLAIRKPMESSFKNAASPANANTVPKRIPTFCSGCPHGRSTQVIEGSRALAGIGCHSIALLKDPASTNTTAQMGAEGAMWMGQAPFTHESHVFTNMGDGTYFHSGILAIRAAVASGHNITYKLLHNGFVSMTGGQPIDGQLSVHDMISQLLAEGVSKIALVSDDVDKYRQQSFPTALTLHERKSLVKVQQKLRETDGVTVLLYEQPCATERRRLRKRGKWTDPDVRVFINSDVCEGCGDCSTVSGCMAIEPLETPLGRKRQINQSSCNKDFSCLEGFCPSLVSVHGATVRKTNSVNISALESDVLSELPEPALTPINGSYSILIAGIGGAGVVTLGQTLAVAAHLDQLFSSNLDITGLAQKYGAVHSHIKIAAAPENLLATRINEHEGDVLIGCDLLVSGDPDTLNRMNPDRASAVVDKRVVPTADFSSNPDWQIDASEVQTAISEALPQPVTFIDFQAVAERLLGDSVYANMMMLGAAWQQSKLPIRLASIMQAIELNGVKIEQNMRAFQIGRALVHDDDLINHVANPKRTDLSVECDSSAEDSFEKVISDRKERLRNYQDIQYANAYEARVRSFYAKIEATCPNDSLALIVAKYYYKVLANKDEWEVARLFSQPTFLQQVDESFESGYKLRFHIGAWPFAKKDKMTGQLQKVELGPWVMRLFKWMARCKSIRNTVIDPFRGNSERMLANALRTEFERCMALVEINLNESNYNTALKLLSFPDKVRGFGFVRERNFLTEMKQVEKLKSLMVSDLIPAENVE